MRKAVIQRRFPWALATLLTSPLALGVDIEAGRTQYADVCAACHGAQGQGQGIFPALTGHSAEAVRDSLNAYRAGQIRGPDSPIMHRVTSPLNDAQVANLAAFIARIDEFQDTTPSPSAVHPAPSTAPAAHVPPVKREGNPAAGGSTFQQVCIRCHGKQGEGRPPMFPRLAGLKPEAVQQALQLYRTHTARGNYSGMMFPIAGTLSDQDIANLGAYVATLGGS